MIEAYLKTLDDLKLEYYSLGLLEFNRRYELQMTIDHFEALLDAEIKAVNKNN